VLNGLIIQPPSNTSPLEAYSTFESCRGIHKYERGKIMPSDEHDYKLFYNFAQKEAFALDMQSEYSLDIEEVPGMESQVSFRGNIPVVAWRPAREVMADATPE
jgi:hypothetical protein